MLKQRQKIDDIFSQINVLYYVTRHMRLRLPSVNVDIMDPNSVMRSRVTDNTRI